MDRQTLAGNDLLVETLMANRAALVDAAQPIVGDRSRAEDVVQDAYLKLGQGPAGRMPERPLAYLYRMVRNLAIDHARRLTLERRHGAGEAVPETVATAEPNPEEALVARDSLRRLAAALGELPPRTRAVFEMSRVGGRNAEQIAAALGISVSLVYTLLRDAMTHCRARMYGGGEDV